MIDKTLAILAGGKSSRMKYNNKALLNYKEKTFIEHIMKAGNSYKEIIIVANDSKPYEKFGLRVVQDIYKGNGPLSGIHSALQNSNTDYVLCIACDMPLTNKCVLDFMGKYHGEYDVLVPIYNEKIQPLCSVFSKRTLGKLEESLKNNENKLQKIILSLDYKAINGLEHRKFNEIDFLNINTPNDFKNLEEF